MKHKTPDHLLPSLFKTLLHHHYNHHHHHQQLRSISKVRLKWVKNRSIDSLIDLHTDLKAACLLKDAIAHRPSSTPFLTAKSIAATQKLLGLTVPTLRFLRRYPTLFHEFPHPNYPSLPCFRLTNVALYLHRIEQQIHQIHQSNTVEKLCKLLMMTKHHQIPLQSLYPLRWDLGFPYDFDKTLIPNHLDKFQILKAPNGLSSLKLVNWIDEFAVSELQKSNEIKQLGKSDDDQYRKFKRGQNALSFPLSFPRGYGAQKKVKSWMDEFQKLPYISPYDDSSDIDPESELMEKRVVGVLHEFLSLTVYKKTKRNYLRNLREELGLPYRFTRIFTRYPGIFYLSLKCKTTTVALKEGYRRGKLVNACPVAKYRGKFHHVMRMGLIYRSKGLEMLPEFDKLGEGEGEDNEIGTEENGSEEEEVESSGEWGEDEDEGSEDVADEY